MEYTETERRILDMWPRFEDGEPVWFGDDVSEIDARSFVFLESGAMVTNLTSVPAYGKFIRYSEPLKRPAPKVLDADGVEIKVGDTVYELETGEEYKVERVFSGTTDPDFPDHIIRCNKVADTITHVFKPDQLTHRHIVLDADGVEIHLGNTVYEPNGQSGIVIAVHPSTR